MKMKRVHVIIHGHVQGVYFRESTKVEALEQGLRGWVRNLPDGTVEAAFEGEAPAVDRMVAWCHNGSSNARVDLVDATEESPAGEPNGFRVTR